MLRALKRAGAEPFVADSPGGPNGPAKVARAYKLSGIADVCAAEGVQIVDVEDDRAPLDAPEGRLYRSFPIGKAFVDADAIIQVGVLKTHQLMRLTGGVKLTYGVIPGLAKAHLHVKAQRREDFADMLLDLHLAVRPRFTIIDAIIAMEGQGPGSGTPRELDSLFAARDCLALDAALADRTAHERRHVYTIAAVGAPRAPRPRRPVPPRRRPDRARPDVQAGAPRHAGAPAAVAAPPGPQPHHGAAPPRRRRRLHPLQRVRRHLRHPGHRHGPAPRLRRRGLRALLRLHRGLPHGGHRQRVAAARPALLPLIRGRVPAAGYWCCCSRLSSVVLPAGLQLEGALGVALCRTIVSPPMGSAMSELVAVALGLIRLLGRTVVQPVLLAVLADLDAAAAGRLPVQAGERVGVAAAAREQRRDGAEPRGAARAGRRRRASSAGLDVEDDDLRAGRRPGTAACWCRRRA